MTFPSKNQRVISHVTPDSVVDIMKAKGPDITFVATSAVTPTHYVSTTDYTCFTRTGNPDIGAYEYH